MKPWWPSDRRFPDTSLAVAYDERLTLRVCQQSRLLSSQVGNSPPDSFLVLENSPLEN